MGPFRQLLLKRRLRQSHEDFIMESAKEVGLSETQIAKTIEDGGWTELIDLVLSFLPDGPIKIILTLVKELFSKL